MTDPAFVELRALVNRWDPLQIFGDSDTADSVDEYDCIVGPLLGMLCAGADTDQIAGFLARHMTEHITGGPPRTPSALEQGLAATVTTWYREYAVR